MRQVTPKADPKTLIQLSCRPRIIETDNVGFLVSLLISRSAQQLTVPKSSCERDPSAASHSKSKSASMYLEFVSLIQKFESTSNALILSRFSNSTANPPHLAQICQTCPRWRTFYVASPRNLCLRMRLHTPTHQTNDDSHLPFPRTCAYNEPIAWEALPP